MDKWKQDSLWCVDLPTFNVRSGVKKDFCSRQHCQKKPVKLLSAKTQWQHYVMRNIINGLLIDYDYETENCHEWLCHCYFYFYEGSDSFFTAPLITSLCMEIGLLFWKKKRALSLEVTFLLLLNEPRLLAEEPDRSNTASNHWQVSSLHGKVSFTRRQHVERALNWVLWIFFNG